MKRKVKKFADGGDTNVRTRTDKEFEEDSKFGGYGRYMPKTKEYTVDEVKDKLSGLFGGKSKTAESEEDYTDAKRRPRTIEEQIKGRPGREIEGKEFAPYRRTPEPEKGSTLKPEPAPSKGGTTYTNEEAINRADAKPVEKTAPKKEKRREENVYPGPNDKRKGQPESTIPKKSLGEDVKPAPAKPSVKKEEPKPLPGKSESKSKPTPYSASRTISKEEEEAEGERGKRMEEEAAAQLKKNKEEAKTSAPAAKKKEYYRDFSGKIKEKTSDDRRPLKDLGETISKGVKSVGEFASKNIKSPAQRRDEEKSVRENQKKYGMKKGGSVSSASSRGDGIAARGKTRGKIC
jgi:hypothetical protein